jgi:hypothetical protein
LSEVSDVSDRRQLASDPPFPIAPAPLKIPAETPIIRAGSFFEKPTACGPCADGFAESSNTDFASSDAGNAEVRSDIRSMDALAEANAAGNTAMDSRDVTVDAPAIAMDSSDEARVARDEVVANGDKAIGILEARQGNADVPVIASDEPSETDAIPLIFVRISVDASALF